MERTKPLILLKSLITAYLLTGIFLLVLAFALYKFRLGENFIDMAVNGVYILTCLIGGLCAGKACGQRKFLWGLAVGVLYFLILLTASILMNKGLGANPSDLLTVLGMCAGSGTVGGMLS